MAEQITRRTTAVAPRGINHLVLNVRDLEESHHFWSDLLGFKRVGMLKPESTPNGMKMWFYSGVDSGDNVNHHDLALAERPQLPEPEEWNMLTGTQAVNHIAITYPDRESWLEQVQYLQDNDAPISLRIDHGMTHSVYLNDPNGYGVEVLYELPAEVWEHDIDGALNYAKGLPLDKMLTDDTEYVTDFT